MSNNAKYINEHNGWIVPETYPGAVKYVRADAVVEMLSTAFCNVCDKGESGECVRGVAGCDILQGIAEAVKRM